MLTWIARRLRGEVCTFGEKGINTLRFALGNGSDYIWSVLSVLCLLIRKNKKVRILSSETPLQYFSLDLSGWIRNYEIIRTIPEKDRTDFIHLCTSSPSDAWGVLLCWN